MARFSLIGPSYRSASLNADCQLTMNWILENIESGQGKGAMALRRRPGLKKLYDLGTAGVRGETTVQGRTFTVAGTQLWELYPPTASPNCKNWSAALGVNLVSDGNPVSLAGGPNQLLIASAFESYVFDLKVNTLVDVTATLGGAVSQVKYADGFYLALFANSDKVQTSAPLDATVWPGGAATTVSVFSGNVAAMEFSQRFLWLFGDYATQVYFDSGNFPFPYDVVSGGYIETGIAAPNSIAQLDNSLFWIQQDKRGSGVVVRANGYTPARVSTHALEYELATYPTIADAVCYGFQEQGHTFYVMNFPSAQKTWAYDCATQQWTQWGFWNATAGIFTQHRGQYHTFNFGMHLVGDPTTGAVYQMSMSIFSDFGNVIRRVRRAPHISNEQTIIFHNELQVDVETGIGPQPPLQGQATPTRFILADALGGLWAVAINDLGVIQSESVSEGGVSQLFLNDPAGNSWQIVPAINTGILQLISVTASTDYTAGQFFFSSTGQTRWNLLLHLAGANPVLDTFPLGIVGRGPTMFLRWSNDGGHTWSNEQARDCGQAGKFSTRVRWLRLGRSRDRVYEISVTDPVDWSLIDAYLFTNQDPQPQERYAQMARKRA